MQKFQEQTHSCSWAPTLRHSLPTVGHCLSSHCDQEQRLLGTPTSKGKIMHLTFCSSRKADPWPSSLCPPGPLPPSLSPSLPLSPITCPVFIHTALPSISHLTLFLHSSWAKQNPFPPHPPASPHKPPLAQMFPSLGARHQHQERLEGALLSPPAEPWARKCTRGPRSSCSCSRPIALGTQYHRDRPADPTAPFQSEQTYSCSSPPLPLRRFAETTAVITEPGQTLCKHRVPCLSYRPAK